MGGVVLLPVARLARARVVEGRAVRSLVDRVDTRGPSLWAPGLEVEPARGPRCLPGVHVLGGEHAHALARALGPLLCLPAAPLVGARLGADHEGKDLVVDLPRVDGQELLEGEEAIHLESLEVAVFLAGLSAGQALVPRLEGLFLLIDGEDSPPLLVQLDVLLHQFRILVDRSWVVRPVSPLAVLDVGVARHEVEHAAIAGFLVRVVVEPGMEALDVIHAPVGVVVALLRVHHDILLHGRPVEGRVWRLGCDIDVVLLSVAPLSPAHLLDLEHRALVVQGDAVDAALQVGHLGGGVVHLRYRPLLQRLLERVPAVLLRHELGRVGSIWAVVCSDVQAPRR